MALFTPKQGVNLSDLPSENKKEQIQLVNNDQWGRMLKELDDPPDVAAGTTVDPVPPPPAAPPAAVPEKSVQAPAATPPAVPAVPPAAPVPSPPKTVHYVCYQWGPFDSDNDKTARKVLAKTHIKYRVTRRETHDIGGYWVYIPNVMDIANQDWEQKLTNANLTYSKTSIKGKNAVSLGYFKNEEAAKQLLNKAHHSGFPTTVLSARDRVTSQLTYRLVQVSPEKSQLFLNENNQLPHPPAVKTVECY